MSRRERERLSARWATDLRVARCEATQRSWRCELDADHDGWHKIGTGEGSNLIHAWPRT